MTNEEYWELCCENKIEDIIDATWDFFSQELPESFINDYDVVNVAFELIGFYEDKKDFQNIISFIKLFQSKQPKIYKEKFYFFDIDLIKYYNFLEDRKKVEESFQNLKNNPLIDYDWFINTYNILRYYGFNELINETIDINYSSVINSKYFLGDGYELASVKHFSLLEEYYKKQDKKAFRQEFVEEVKKYNYETTDNFLIPMIQGLFNPLIEKSELKKYFNLDFEYFYMLLKMYFLRYMKEKNISFNISQEIYSYLLLYCNNNIDKSTADLFFQLDGKKLKNYINKQIHTNFLDDRPEQIAFIWGCVYLYDFLKELYLVSEKTYKNSISILNRLKGYYIGFNLIDLWEFNYVHTWGKPDSITETEFLEEEKLFRKTFLLKRTNFDDYKKEISSELKNLENLAEHIIKGIKKQFEPLKLNPMFAKMFSNKKSKHNKKDDFEKDYDEDYEEELTEYRNISEPVRVEPKIGRNDPCPCGSGKKYKKCCMKNND